MTSWSSTPSIWCSWRLTFWINRWLLIGLLPFGPSKNLFAVLNRAEDIMIATDPAIKSTIQLWVSEADFTSSGYKRAQETCSQLVPAAWDALDPKSIHSFFFVRNHKQEVLFSLHRFQIPMDSSWARAKVKKRETKIMF